MAASVSYPYPICLVASMSARLSVGVGVRGRGRGEGLGVARLDVRGVAQAEERVEDDLAAWEIQGSYGGDDVGR